MGRYLERYGPLLLSLITFFTLLYFVSLIKSSFASHKWSSEGLYSSVFNWAAIQTGFVFGVYGFVAGKKDGFLYDLRETRFLRDFIKYTRRATSVGFVLSMISVPLIVANPKLGTSGYIPYALVAAWFSIFVWAFSAFMRVALIFGRLISVRDKRLLSA